MLTNPSLVHANNVIDRMATRMFKQQELDKALTGQWRYGQYVPWDVLRSRAADNYYDLEMRQILKPEAPDLEAQKAEGDRRMAEVIKNTEGRETRLRLEGKEAKAFDEIFQEGKQKAKARTPMVTSIPGMPAKRSIINK